MLDYVRWVMVRKRRREVVVPVHVPELTSVVAPGALVVPPGGWVADRIGRERALTLGWWLYALSWMGFGLATRPWMAGFALLGYGAYYGLTEGTERALVATLAEQRSLGRAYGAFNLVAGLVALPASVMFGRLLRWYGPRAAFGVGAALAAAAALGMTAQWGRRRA